MADASNKHFAFIGGGSTGPVLVIYLAKFASAQKADLSKYVFHLIDPNGFGNGGLAYGQNDPRHILNTRRGEMSPWNKHAFHNYLISIGRGGDQLEFNLRSDFRDFLKLEFAKACQILESLGVTFKVHRTLAFIRCIGGQGFAVQDEAGRLIDPALATLPAGNIVLTVGYGPNNAFADLRRYQEYGFINSMYPPEALSKMLASKSKPVHIGVIGSAAALYDFTVACPLAPDELKLTIFSSATSGLEVRQVEGEYALKDLKLNSLRTLSPDAVFEDLKHAVQAEFAEAVVSKSGPPTWVAYRIMSIIGEILSRLDISVAQTFRASAFFKNLKRLGGPTTAFSKVKLDAYSPQFVQAEITASDITLGTDETFVIRANSQSYPADIVINATGHGRHNSPILEDFKAQKLAAVDSRLYILSTDDTGYILTESKIACIGPATHFGTDGVETFAGPAEKLAQAMVIRLAQSSV